MAGILARRTISRVGVVCCAALLCLGCELRDEPRQRSFPRLDASQVFSHPEARAAVADEVSTDEVAAEDGDEFETWLGGSAEQPESEGSDAQSVSLQRVVVGGGLVGSIPRRSGEWSWARSDGTTLIVHMGGDRADAVIYAQELAVDFEERPSVDVDRFHRAVAPSLARHAWWPAFENPALPALAAEVASRTELSLGEAEHALEALLLPTLGVGLGMRATPGSFSGWRWIGHNPSQVELRLGRIAGVWGSVDELDRGVRVVLDLLAGRSDRIADLRSRVGESVQGRRESTPAEMVVGNATLANRQGAHLAILCRQTPECPVVDDLERFLDSLRPADRGEELGLLGGTRPSDLGSLARRCGLLLLSSDETLDLGELGPLAGLLSATPAPTALEPDGALQRTPVPAATAAAPTPEPAPGAGQAGATPDGT